MKKIISMLLAVILTAGIFVVPAKAEEEVITGELELLSYNIAGLPIPAMFRRKGRIAGRSFWKDTEVISKLVGEADYDLVAVQEDFNAHSQMTKHMDAYPWQTYHSGAIPYGDGLNYFSKMPLYNAERIKWNMCYGVFDGATDELTPKGIQYALWEIEPGVYVDVYNHHLEAGSTPSDVEARYSDLKQLADLVNERSKDRAVLILGDFNTCLGDPRDRLYELLVEPAGLKDAWAEVHNGGVYEGIPRRVDGIDRVMYRDGGGIEFKAIFEEKAEYLNEKGKTASDHKYCHVTMSYTFTGTPQKLEGLKELEKEPFFEFLWKAIKYCFKDIGLMIKDLPTLFKK